jgi:hypothetical protein
MGRHSGKTNDIRDQILDQIQASINQLMAESMSLNTDEVVVFMPKHFGGLLFDHSEVKGAGKLTKVFGHDVLPNYEKNSIVISNIMSIGNKSITLRIQ